jgi:hypothetical protein
VIDRGNGQWWVKSTYYGVWTVNGGCTCPDAQFNRVRWCKHRLAVALVLKARRIENGTGEADTSPAPTLPPTGDTLQKDDTTDPDWAQVESLRAVWGSPAVELWHADGRHEVRHDLTHAEAEATVKALGWREYGDRACLWLNPAFDAEREEHRRRCHEQYDAMLAESEARRAAALPTEHTRGRAKLFKS